MNPVLFAIPFFLLSIGTEWLVDRRRGAEGYRLPDMICNISLGMGQLLTALIIKVPLLALYALLSLKLSQAGLSFSFSSESWGHWVGAFLLVDFAYYWFHRVSHERSFLWAAHAVHHQSEDYNLSVALRQSWLQQCFSGLFYLPLAFWIPPAPFFLLNALNTLSQFWIHTEQIKRLPRPFEWILNTPAHHRVHHAVDQPYVDKNYAGALIIWDRLFGTFVEEKARPRYGVLKPLRRWDPWAANWDPWAQLLQRARAQRSWWRRLQIFWMGPAWLAPDESPPSVLRRDAPSYVRYAEDSALPRSYLLCRFAFTLALSTWLVAVAGEAERVTLAGGVVLCLFALSASARLIERASGRWRWELLSGAGLILLAAYTPWWSLSVTVASALWLWSASLARHSPTPAPT